MLKRPIGQNVERLFERMENVIYTLPFEDENDAQLIRLLKIALTKDIKKAFNDLKEVSIGTKKDKIIIMVIDTEGIGYQMDIGFGE